MGAGYSFVDLTDEQKHLRRHLLDRYGLIAQASVLVPLVVLQAYFAGAWCSRKWRQHRNLTVPSSPVLKSIQSGDCTSLQIATSTLRRVIWWCGDDISVLGSRLGTKGEVLSGVIWTAWLLSLSFLQTGNDYLHLTKRLGTVAASQLPFHYLLAVKTPYSPLQALTHASHETLNTTHQILGRIITVFMLAHVTLYLNFYVQLGVLLSRLQETIVILGLVSIILFVLLNTSSLATIRRASYRVFLTLHILISLVVLPLLYFHVHHIRMYIYETLAVVALNAVFRALSAQMYTDASMSIVPDTQLLDITIPAISKAIERRWLPGQHAYLSLPTNLLTSAVAKNPFTVSSVPSVDHNLRFVARIHRGNTAALATTATASGKAHRLLVEGPYGATTHPDRLLTYDRVLFIAGGIGATFVMPLYRQLLSDLSPTPGSYRRQKVSAVWITKSVAETAWAIPDDKIEREGFFDRLRVFVTGDGPASLLADDAAIDPYGRLDTQNGADGAADEAIELEERIELLSKQDHGALAPHSAPPLYAGRPDLARLVEQVMSGTVKEKIAIVVCGPPKLGQDVRRHVGIWVHRGRDIWFWNESFSL